MNRRRIAFTVKRITGSTTLRTARRREELAGSSLREGVLDERMVYEIGRLPMCVR